MRIGRRASLWAMTAVLLLVAGLLWVNFFGGSEPTDDLDYLVWEVCSQVNQEGMTADRLSDILVDATRHGAIMSQIEAECGDTIASIYRNG
ncbi:MAG: hypothetical protein F4211_01815 [Acidimicrobiia bacterium]|nr:hypothetical protein [Acidimicrobiia bacterium]